MGVLKSLKRKYKHAKVKPTGVVHDYGSYRRRFWGHDYAIRKVEGMTVAGSLWSPRRVRVGDYLLLQNGESSTRYLLVEVEGVRDPDDMYHFTALFAPRKKGEA